MLVTEPSANQIVAGSAGVAPEVVAQMRSSEGEQHLVDERERRRGALDVEEHGPRGHARAGDGMYDGPKHTGWKPSSMPVLV